MSIIEKLTMWWYEHEHQIAVMATLFAILNLIFLGLTLAAVFNQIALLHDIEVQLAAHGVDWALYTPAP